MGPPKRVLAGSPERKAEEADRKKENDRDAKKKNNDKKPWSNDKGKDRRRSRSRGRGKESGGFKDRPPKGQHNTGDTYEIPSHSKYGGELVSPSVGNLVVHFNSYAPLEHICVHHTAICNIGSKTDRNKIHPFMSAVGEWATFLSIGCAETEVRRSFRYVGESSILNVDEMYEGVASPSLGYCRFTPMLDTYIQQFVPQTCANSPVYGVTSRRIRMEQMPDPHNPPADWTVTNIDPEQFTDIFDVRRMLDSDNATGQIDGTFSHCKAVPNMTCLLVGHKARRSPWDELSRRFLLTFGAADNEDNRRLLYPLKDLYELPETPAQQTMIDKHFNVPANFTHDMAWRSICDASSSVCGCWSMPQFRSYIEECSTTDTDCHAVRFGKCTLSAGNASNLKQGSKVPIAVVKYFEEANDFHPYRKQFREDETGFEMFCLDKSFDKAQVSQAALFGMNWVFNEDSYRFGAGCRLRRVNRKRLLQNPGICRIIGGRYRIDAATAQSRKMVYAEAARTYIAKVLGSEAVAN